MWPSYRFEPGKARYTISTASSGAFLDRTLNVLPTILYCEHPSLWAIPRVSRRWGPGPRPQERPWGRDPSPPAGRGCRHLVSPRRMGERGLGPEAVDGGQLREVHLRCRSKARFSSRLFPALVIGDPRYPRALQQAEVLLPVPPAVLPGGFPARRGLPGPRWRCSLPAHLRVQTTSFITISAPGGGWPEGMKR